MGIFFLLSLFFFFSFAVPSNRFVPMHYMFTETVLFSHTTVFWQTTLLESLVTCIYEVFVSVLMASIWLLERKISRSEYVSSLLFSDIESIAHDFFFHSNKQTNQERLTRFGISPKNTFATYLMATNKKYTLSTFPSTAGSLSPAQATKQLVSGI